MIPVLLLPSRHLLSRRYLVPERVAATRQSQKLCLAGVFFVEVSDKFTEPAWVY